MSSPTDETSSPTMSKPEDKIANESGDIASNTSTENDSISKEEESAFEDNAGFISRLFLLYLDPLLKLGAKKTLEQEDVGAPSKVDRASPVYQMAKLKWEEEVIRCDASNEKRRQKYEVKRDKITDKKKRDAMPPFKRKPPSMAKVLFRAAGPCNIMFAMTLYVISSLLQFVPVLLLNDLVSYFEALGTDNPYEGYVNPWVEVVGLGVIPLIISVVQAKHQVMLMHTSIFVRTAVSTMLYDKSMKVSASGRAQTSTGQVVNMMSNDTNQLQRFIQFLGMTATAPVQIIIALILIYQQVGNATWVGVAFMVCLAPVNVIIFNIVGKYRRKVLKYSDLRVKMMNEILAGIRIIKFYAWEKPFRQEVGKLREKEVKFLTWLAYVSAVGFSMILLSAPIIQPILVFLTYINIQDEPLTAAKAFTTVALFNIMRFPFAFMPMGLLQFVQSRISIHRLETYMSLPDLSPYVITTPPSSSPDDPTSKPGSVTIQNGTFSWIDPDYKPPAEPKKKKNKKKDDMSDSTHSRANIPKNLSALSLASMDREAENRNKPILNDISCHIEAGSLIAVVGTVGSGKSSFLSAIMGEMEAWNDSKVYLPKGEEDENHFLAYCAQSPWVVNDTLRGNILFGREYEETRYNQVVKACALTDDLAILPAGDMTEIGEKGINLSGGQKARVSLARAIYSSHTKVLLMDDPLSAVDAHVGEHIFAQSILGPLTDGMTRILVTHHVHLLPRCDKVIVLEGGAITHYGHYEELIENGVDFKGAVDVAKTEEATEETEGGKDDTEIQQSSTNDNSNKKTDKGIPADLTDDQKTEKQALAKKGEKLISDEERETGNVSGSAYVKYARAGGIFYVIIMVFVQAAGRASEIMASFWLAIWSERAINGLTEEENTFYINIYALFGMLGVFGLTVRAILMAIHRLYASRKIHDDLSNSILRAPVSFFDVTPIGRILNRFAADMDKVDLELTQSLGQGLSTTFSMLGALGAIIAATKGVFLVPLVPMGYFYYIIQKWFRKTSTELQRINSIGNSPIFADFSQILSGTSTVRAYGEQNRFFTKNHHSFDKMNASYSMVQLTNYWLGIRLDLLGGFISAFIGGLAVATAPSGFIPAGWLGLALSYSIEITGFLKFGVRMIATIEAEMNSVERILHYSENVEPEAPDIIPEKDPKQGTWPKTGKIEIANASMRYRQGPLVLKDITVTFEGGEKVGVVGRTGSGKSSLMILLFRICEIDPDGKGRVVIDDVDTAEIGTEALRLGLSIIPQDPVMFSNTVRYNLDPFNAATDEEIWEVLQKVTLGEVIASLTDGLYEKVTEGGENFSQGQRQLLCIARSLLRKPKILVMDEATASIDNETDAQIQKMIRENFSDATVLTIAHRLNTIMDSDRVLVLDDGEVAEFDSPEALLEKEEGIFKSMVEKSKSSRGDGE